MLIFENTIKSSATRKTYLYHLNKFMLFFDVKDYDGLEEKYIDAFCGRMSQNVIRKHYTDYSPEAMRKHYDRVEPYLGLPFTE